MNETERIYNSVEGSIGFICLLCGGNQILPHDNHKVTFPVCDECKKDLGEIIKEKRNGKNI